MQGLWLVLRLLDGTAGRIKCEAVIVEKSHFSSGWQAELVLGDKGMCFCSRPSLLYPLPKGNGDRGAFVHAVWQFEASSSVLNLTGCDTHLLPV